MESMQCRTEILILRVSYSSSGKNIAKNIFFPVILKIMGDT